MPDVTRSDSQRSDASHKPRVSFNRDVHVKRIGREGVVSALAGDGEGHLVPLPVRRERPGRLSRRELEREAEAVLRQVDRVNCTPSTLGPDKFNTLPPRPRNKQSGHQPLSAVFNSLERRKKKNLQGEDSVRLKRRYSNPDNSSSSWGRSLYAAPERSSPEVPVRRKLNRSVSDAGRRDDKDKERGSIFGTLDRIRKKKKGPTLPEMMHKEEVVPPVRKKKQLSPIIELSPKVEADGFRFAPTDGQVVYAEVVARPGGKTTVHTAVSAHPSSRPHQRIGSDEDEGVDMGHRGTESRRFSYESDILRPTSPRDLDSTLKKRNDDIREDKIINMLRSRSNPLLDEDLVGGYKREYRTERVIRIGGSEEPDGRGRADGTDFSRRSSKDFVDEVPLRSSYFGEGGKIHSYDQLDKIKYQEPVRAWTPPLETSLIDSNDLSYRRNRLESRLTNQKRRFLSTAHEGKSYRDDKMKGEDLRKELLITQLNGDQEKGYFEKKIASEIDSHHRQQMLKNKDVFADSGVELSDYRKEPSKDVATLNRKNAETTRIYRTETTRTKSIPVLNKIDYYSDGERRYKGDISSRFIEEERRRRDVIPNSTSLVKTYSKPVKEEPFKATKKEEKYPSEKKKDKLTRMDKVKQLMFGGKDKNKKKKKQDGNEDDLLRKRYTEYKGSDVSVNSSPVIHRRRQTSSSEVDERTDQELEFYGSRQRLATPSPSLRASESKTEDTWFKSLTRRNKHSKADKKAKSVNGHSEDSHQSSNKTLRFFGDSDHESLKSGHHVSSRTRDSSPNPHLLQVPHKRTTRRHFAPDSSAESTTEDSNHSQKSIVYLHAATVGDIPGSRKLHKSVISGGRRSMSREELSSNTEAITPQTRTLSRSISVLAPWRPKHNRQEINYDHGGKPPKPPKQRRPAERRLDAKDKSDKTKRSTRELRASKENLIDSRRGSSESILSDKRSRGNLVFVGKREISGDHNHGSSTLGRARHTTDRSQHSEKRDLSRSISIPKDSRVSSGWFKGKQKN